MRSCSPLGDSTGDGARVRGFTPARRPSAGRAPSTPGRRPACLAPCRAPLAAQDAEAGGALPHPRRSEPRAMAARGPWDNRALCTGSGAAAEERTHPRRPQSRQTRPAPSCRAGSACALARVRTAWGGGGDSGVGAGRAHLPVSQASSSDAPLSSASEGHSLPLARVPWPPPRPPAESRLRPG